MSTDPLNPRPSSGDAPDRPTREELKSSLQAVLELAAHEREGYLTELRASDPALADSVRELLRAHTRAGSFMAEPTRAHSPGSPGGSWSGVDEERPWDEVGAYVLQDRLGEGGFAVVWRARQERPVRREVALKILKAGMDSKQVLTRFEGERQTLAMLSHPSIARVLDAGTTPRGRPYFAMELVPGTPVTEYCDARRMTVGERLRLFVQVCEAVEHAHQKGVIHRDLKPSNVLVTTLEGKALPVVIDFGIAKVVAGDGSGGSGVTEARQIVGTPQYMAPEQADAGVAGHALAMVDTRTDVYSLGVMLYELLAGVSPYDTTRLRGAGFMEVARAVREAKVGKASSRFAALKEEEQERIAVRRRTDPQALARQLRGDLDWVILRATSKDPEQRYPTASALAADIGAHLQHRPVAAGPPSTLYLATKFVRRHRAVVVAGCVTGVALVGGLVTALAGLAEATRLRVVAEAALDSAESRLWEASLAQARANRQSSTPGRRERALAAVRDASAIRASLELRNEAIAALALDDVEFRPGPLGVRGASAWGQRAGSLFVRTGVRASLHVARAGDNVDVLSSEQPEGEVMSAAFNAEGTVVAAVVRRADSARVDVWDVPGRRRLLQADGAPRLGYDVCVAGKAWVGIVAPEQREVQVRSLADGGTLLRVPISDVAVRIDASPDGAVLAIADFGNKCVEAWSVPSGSRLFRHELEAAPMSVALDARGGMLAAGLDDRSIVLVRVGTGETTRVLTGHQGLAMRLAFIQDGRVLVSSSWDNTVRFWEVQSGRQLLGELEGWTPAGLGDEFLAVSGEACGFWRFDVSGIYQRLTLAGAFGVNSNGEFIGNGRMYVTAGDNGVHAWDLDAGVHLMTLSDQRANSVAVCPERNAVVAACDAGVVEWTLSVPDHAVATTRLLFPAGPVGRVWVARIPPGDGMGERLAIVAPDAITIMLADRALVQRRIPAYTGLAEAPSVSPDARWLFTGNWRGDAGRVWDLRTGGPAHDFQGSHVVARFSPDGGTLVVGTPGAFTGYETGTWKPLWSAPREWADNLAGVIAFAPDASFVAVGHTRSWLRLLDPKTGLELASLRGPDRLELNDALVSADGRELLCTTVDREVQRWDLARMRERLRSIHPGLDLPMTPAKR